MQGVLNALSVSNVCTDNWDSLLVTICASKLTKLIRALWEALLRATLSTSQGATNPPPSKGVQNPPTSRNHSNPFRSQGSPTPNKVHSFNTQPNVQSYFASSTSTVLLGTALINICHLGTNFRGRALIDSGSEATFITERLFNIIKPPFEAIQAQVAGLNQTVAAKAQRRCHFMIGAASRPVLKIETIFGWVLSGPVSADSTRTVSAFTTKLSLDSDVRLEKLLTKFWEVKDLPGKPTSESDSVCEENFRKTTKRAPDGKYIVTLPFKSPENVDLGHSRCAAQAQFLKNEQRLQRNLPLKEQYDAVIQEYLELGHMTAVTPSHDSGHYYLPHHAVFKPDSTTTKLRVVFNASSPSSNGKSLNDTLHSGPVLQSDLTMQILRWRVFRYVFNADISKMYREILVSSQHTPYQRILFRDRNGDVCDFELATVTFGVNCTPYLALRVIKQLAQEVRPQLPMASDILESYMYVDDVLTGAHTQSPAISAISELRKALDSSGFPLRKWTANHKGVLRDIPVDHLLRADFLELDESSIAKTLGIRWQANADEFYSAPPEVLQRESCTKRNVLSQIAQLFDPAGWLAPFVIQAKMFMQEIWLRELGWDDVLPSDLSHTWETFLKSFPAIQDIRIPRWLHVCPMAKVQIHGFCDASQRAYGAAIYIRVERPQGIVCALLTAKARVAPVKTVSLPRLELCGAVLLTELSEAILPQLPLDTSQVSFWTDSTIVLAWLNRPACDWTTFVGNRVAKITRCWPSERWSHVRSEDNPVDLASRGLGPTDLVESDMWWHGPAWLRGPKSEWPCPRDSVLQTDLEKRVVKVHHATSSASDILSRFSDLGRALRVIAYVRRFTQRVKGQTTHVSKELNGNEVAATLQAVTLTTQRFHYAGEHRCLLNKQPLPTTSSLLNLNPFLDQNGVMRACGRVQASASMSSNERHPILLPPACLLVRLLVRFTHHISLHGGNQLVIRLIRETYWIPRLRHVVRAVIHSCKVCVLHHKRLQTQLISDLPASRVTFSRPFTYTGVDFAGPFDVKSFTGRACRISKGYVCVFVCFSTKAIHLEATSDLSTDTFLAAFARFVARRGCPHEVQSDNGRNFVGASRSLAVDLLEALRTRTSAVYSQQGLSWRFIPPGAPHMGGLWEAGVKSFKALFQRSMCTSKYTLEEFATLLSKIEACLNSRPISPMSEDPTDPLALSPGHFLIGGPLLSVAEPEIQASASSILNRWQHLKALNQQFYLVVIKEENIPAQEWRPGRVQNAYPGADDKVRVVDLLTARGLIKRPITMVVLLPMESDVLSTYSRGGSDS
ncbi:uncharacterized protein LOC121404235 [Drosophila obscura]|uniref:uncharacterized protein LOC121404235 n=1 Tax=Drosophila obscura TaxID=7282 RepID=UPI001BB25738|nr:uncharacterized protein LOC121404235 [Drosophila obscura]